MYENCTLLLMYMCYNLVLYFVSYFVIAVFSVKDKGNQEANLNAFNCRGKNMYTQGTLVPDNIFQLEVPMTVPDFSQLFIYMKIFSLKCIHLKQSNV